MECPSLVDVVAIEQANGKGEPSMLDQPIYPEPETVGATAAWPKPEIPVYGERPAQLKRVTLLGIGFFRLLPLAIVGIGSPLVIRNVNELEALATRGRPVEATIEDLRVVRSKSTSYRVEYAYPFRRMRYEGATNVDRDWYYRLAIGSPLRVTMLPDDPQVHRVGVVDQAWVTEAQRTGSGIVLILSALAAIIAWVYRYSAIKERDMLATWPAATALVTESKSKYIGKSGYRHDLVYCVRLPSGHIRDDKYRFTNGAKSIPVHEGGYMTVLLDSDKPKSRPLVSLNHCDVASVRSS